ncbi:MAG: phospho-sugar mutase [Polyangiaceae bacterium]|nr:phospho-sugar mutase [Polyangiaceae bacterium]
MEQADSSIDAARRWIAQDPDPETRAELEQLIASGNLAEVRERMLAPLEFGTAGLRGVVGAGLGRMNRAVVIRATRGLAEYLLARGVDARTLPVVVGFDGRLSSRRFAEDTVGVLVAAGIPVRFFPEPVPTPMVAHAARELSASAAIVITASHNPPEYNGYKVYAANAAQIVSPVDQEISARIAAVQSATVVPLAAGAMSGAHPSAEPVPEAFFDRYLAEVDALRPRIERDQKLCIVYTPMHGVGWRYVKRTFERSGYPNVHVVADQAEPDGRFPTVNFPNPEEPGALDRAMSLADEKKADLILANDPDADRLAVCIPSATGRFRQLTGNQVGLLLADFMLEHALAAPRPLVASSIVSSPMLGAIAAAHGARFEQTLTGFKWIWNAALDLEAKEGVRFAFGYEEALGYSVGRIVRDKDGVSAALLLADLAAHEKTQGRGLGDRLERLYRKHGLWVSVQKSITRPGSDGLAEIERAMQGLAAAPPQAVGGTTVARVTDFRVGADARPRWLPATPLISLELEGGGRVLVRPSGTEPKLKIYVDLCVPLRESERLSVREEEALAQAQALANQVAVQVGLG